MSPCGSQSLNTQASILVHSGLIDCRTGNMCLHVGSNPQHTSKHLVHQAKPSICTCTFSKSSGIMMKNVSVLNTSRVLLKNYTCKNTSGIMLKIPCGKYRNFTENISIKNIRNDTKPGYSMLEILLENMSV